MSRIQNAGRCLWPVTLATLLSVSVATAQPPVAITWVGQWGGPSSAVAVDGSRVYVGDGHYLSVFDLTVPTTPALLGKSEPMNEPVYGIAVVVPGEVVAVADGWAGLYFFDVSNPAAPILAGEYDTIGESEDVQALGNFVFVADGDQGLGIVDVSAPSAPYWVGGFDTSGHARDVVVSGGMAYIADGVAGLQIVDVTIPEAPVHISTLTLSDEARGLAVFGSHAFVAAGYLGGFVAIDVSDPSAPAVAGSCGTNGLAESVSVLGSHAFVADSWAGLTIIDISDPLAPTPVAAEDTPDWAAEVALGADLACVADQAGGLQVINITDPEDPAVVGSSSNASGPVVDVEIAGSLVLVADGRSVKALDVQTPSTPILQGETGSHEFAWGLTFRAPFAYLADGCAGFGVIDVTDPQSPQRVGTANLECAARDTVVSGDYAYVANDRGILHVVDVSNPALPAEVGKWQDPEAGYALGVAVSGQIALLAGAEQGLHLIDVSVAATPNRIGRLDTPGSSLDVDVAGPYAYVADSWNGLLIVDITTPASPLLVGGCTVPGSAEGVFVTDAYAFIAAGFGGLVIVDIKNPDAPTVVGAQETPGWARRVAASGQYVYVADQSNGLMVFQIPEPVRDYVWNEPLGGVFDDPMHWTPAGPPSTGDRAIFDLPDSYTVTFPGNQTFTNAKLLVNGGEVRLDLSGSTYILSHTGDGNPSIAIGDQSSGPVDAALTMSNGNIMPKELVLGRWPENSGRLLLDHAAWIANENFCNIGVAGYGEFNLVNQSSAIHQSSSLGFEESGEGNLTLDGTDARWDVTDEIVVGRAGTGTMFVANAAEATARRLVAGELSTGVGHVLIEGGGTLNITESQQPGLVVGSQGYGFLGVQTGGRVFSTATMYFADQTNSGGDLDILSGATVDVIGELAMGRSNGAESIGLLDDADLAIHGHLIVGGHAGINDGGTGDLTISGSGHAEAEHVRVGDGAGGIGTLSVDGADSRMEIGVTLSPGTHSQMEIGPRGDGTVVVSGGGGVQVVMYPDGYSGLTILGGGEGGAGYLIISGTDSLYESLAQIQVGRRAMGDVRVEAQGVLRSLKGTSPTSSSGIIGMDIGGTGTVTVTGQGSRWEQDGALSVGWLSAGELRLEDGGLVECASGIVARMPGSTGAVTITDADSTWRTTGDLTIGGLPTAVGGVGNVIVAQNGRLEVGSTLLLWDSGILDVNGGSVIIGDPVLGPTNTVTVNAAGTLAGRGVIQANLHNVSGIVTPGAATGILTVNGDFQQQSAGRLHFEINGHLPGEEYDRLVISGTALLGGVMEVTLGGGFVPEVGDRFELMSFEVSTSEFADIELPSQVPDRIFAVEVGPNSVELLVGLPGDVNCDGVLNTADIDPLVMAMVDREGYEAAFPACKGEFADLNEDRSVNGGDLQEFVNALLVP